MLGRVAVADQSAADQSAADQSVTDQPLAANLHYSPNIEGKLANHIFKCCSFYEFVLSQTLVLLLRHSTTEEQMPSLSQLLLQQHPPPGAPVPTRSPLRS